MWHDLFWTHPCGLYSLYPIIWLNDQLFHVSELIVFSKGKGRKSVITLCVISPTLESFCLPCAAAFLQYCIDTLRWLHYSIIVTSLALVDSSGRSGFLCTHNMYNRHGEWDPLLVPATVLLRKATISWLTCHPYSSMSAVQELGESRGTHIFSLDPC